MTDWLSEIQAIDALAGCRIDPTLVHELQARATRAPMLPLDAATPSFQAYATSEMTGCCKSAFPVFSITGSACALQCDHCQARILEPMIAVPTPELLEAQVRALAERKILRGFLLSGGSNRRNEIAYERFYPAIERIKRDFPLISIAVHSALLDRPRAHTMADAGIDVAMMDVIGAEETIRQVYHLDRAVTDFEQTLAALCETRMAVVPHIVIGLHYGRILGERHALELVSKYPIDALVLVVVMPVHAKPATFVTPDAGEVARLFMDARAQIGGTRLNLGCARPHGLYRRTIDAYAIMAGLDGIAFPSEGTLTLAKAIGRPISASNGCCAMKPGGNKLRTPTMDYHI